MKTLHSSSLSPIELSLFSSRIESICDEMGAALKRAAFSPNIKDRLDFSCAIFDQSGQLSAQAAHIPVHLGSMAYAMESIVADIEWHPGDMVVVNDPYKGGTHLPDVTVIAPVFEAEQLIAFVANRAHHANIGASSPGSMPVSSRLQEEGIGISPTHIVSQGTLQASVMETLAGLPTGQLADGGGQQGLSSVQMASLGDFSAQVSANRIGVQRLSGLIRRYGAEGYQQLVKGLNDYAETLAWQSLKSIPDGQYRFEDQLDDDGVGHQAIPIVATLDVNDGHIHVDFAGTSSQVNGNVNCPLSVAAAAVFYCFRCLMPEQMPVCAGAFRMLNLKAEKGSLLNAEFPAAVAAGNVETSTRIVDVILGALAQAIPQRIPAASHGSMNNLAMGWAYKETDEAQSWDYYETMAGGMGASSNGPGLSAVQTHMTNTLNTPVESLESHYPLQVKRYAIRQGSAGQGEYCGGEGLERELVFRDQACVTLLTERRQSQPWGLQGGQPGQSGVNRLNGETLPAKTTFQVKAGDVLSIATPGGGGWGVK